MTNPVQYTLCFAAVIGYQLFIPPPVSLANNGDFGKVIGRFCLAAPVADEINFAATRYTFDSSFCHRGEFNSSEVLLVAASLVLNNCVSKLGDYDIRVIGAVHLSIFLATAWLAWPLFERLGRRTAWLPMAASVFIYSDAMYAAYLSSFYMDVAALLGFLLAAVSYLRFIAWRRQADLWLFTGSAILTVTAKGQHAVIGLWAVAALLLASRSKARVSLPVLAGCLAIVCAAAIGLSITPSHYRARNRYSAIFFQLLPHVADRGRALNDLGLDAGYLPHVGKHAYSPGSHMDETPFIEDFMRRTSYSKLFAYYLLHPVDTYSALVQSLNEAGRQRPVLATFDRKYGLPALTESQSFAWWSDLKRTLFFFHGHAYFWSLVALWLAASLATWMRRCTLGGGSAAGMFLLVGVCVSELIVSSLADGVEAPRHHLIFYAATDLLVLCGIAVLASRPDPQPRLR